MYRAYSKNELRAVHDIITTFGHVTYQDGSMLEVNSSNAQVNTAQVVLSICVPGEWKTVITTVNSSRQ